MLLSDKYQKLNMLKHTEIYFCVFMFSSWRWKAFSDENLHVYGMFIDLWSVRVYIATEVGIPWFLSCNVRNIFCFTSKYVERKCRSTSHNHFIYCLPMHTCHCHWSIQMCCVHTIIYMYSLVLASLGHKRKATSKLMSKWREYFYLNRRNMTNHLADLWNIYWCGMA